MALNKGAVLVGTADQQTTGAIAKAPIGTPLPTEATAALDAAFVSGGYVSENGLSLTPEYSTVDIREWNGKLVRRLKQSFDGTLNWEMLQTDAESMRTAFGDDNVTVTPADATHGNRMAIQLGKDLPERASWALSMKDGSNRVRIVVPDGQITTVGEVSFTSSAAVIWPVTLSTYPDENGVNLYIYTDDGVLTV